MASCHHNLGDVLLATADPEGARASWEASLAIWERLVTQNPSVTAYQDGLATSRGNLGVLLHKSGDPEGAGVD